MAIRGIHNWENSEITILLRILGDPKDLVGFLHRINAAVPFMKPEITVLD